MPDEKAQLGRQHSEVATAGLGALSLVDLRQLRQVAEDDRQERVEQREGGERGERREPQPAPAAALTPALPERAGRERQGRAHARVLGRHRETHPGTGPKKTPERRLERRAQAPVEGEEGEEHHQHVRLDLRRGRDVGRERRQEHRSHEPRGGGPAGGSATQERQPLPDPVREGHGKRAVERGEPAAEQVGGRREHLAAKDVRSLPAGQPVEGLARAQQRGLRQIGEAGIVGVGGRPAFEQGAHVVQGEALVEVAGRVETDAALGGAQREGEGEEDGEEGAENGAPHGRRQRLSSARGGASRASVGSSSKSSSAVPGGSSTRVVR